MPDVKTIIFDLDGVLVEAKHWHYLALNKALCKVDGRYQISEQEHEETFDGLSTRQKLMILTDSKALPIEMHEQIYTDKQSYTLEFVEQCCRPKENVKTTIKALKALGFKIGVCSNAIRISVETMLQKSEIFDLIDIILSNSDVQQKKPNPEIYTMVCKNFGVSPVNVLVVEDNINGIRAARSAGCNLLIVNSPDDVTIDNINRRLEALRRPKIVDLIIPAAGAGSRFAKQGYKKAKPFIDVRGKMMLERVLENLTSKKYVIRPTIIFLEEHLDIYADEIEFLRKKFDINTVTVDKKTEGAACTILFARKVLGNNPVVLANSDQIIDFSFDEFLDNSFDRMTDGNILCFTETQKSSKWSYVKLDKNNKAVRVAEKERISRYATVGIYYFDDGIDMVDNTVEMIINNKRTNGEFYLCPVFNEFIANNASVTIELIKEEEMHGVGTPEDLAIFLNS